MNAETLSMTIVVMGVAAMLYMAARSQKRVQVTEAKEPALDYNSLLENRINQLDGTVKTLLDNLNTARLERERERETYQRELEGMRQALIKANERIHELEMLYEREIVEGKRALTKRRPLRPLLVICGTDPDMVGSDLHMLDGIGIRYTRLLNASTKDVMNEFTRIGRDDRYYPWVLITADTDDDGTVLRDVKATPDFWVAQLSGTEVVGLATCKGTAIADHLAEKVNFVWYFREGVETGAASLFVQKFFQRLSSGETPENAFISCLDAVPSVAPFADYRMRKK